MLRSSARLFAVLAGAALGAAALAGCASTVSLQPAARANDPQCAEVTAHLPQNIDGLDRRWTDAQATGAWGDPTAVILTCGLEPSAASPLPCQTVAGVDWLIDDTEAPNYRFTSFGRSPAVQVYVDYDRASSFEVLRSLSRLVAKLPTDGKQCTAAPGTDDTGAGEPGTESGTESG